MNLDFTYIYLVSSDVFYEPSKRIFFANSLFLLLKPGSWIDFKS